VIDSLTTQRRSVDDRARDARIVVDDLAVEQQKIDADVEQERIDRGEISNPKDLQRMLGELESLQRRVTTLEDEELEVMQKVEDAQRELDTLTAEVTEIDEQLTILTAARDEKTAELDRQLEALTTEREPIVAGLPEDLLALYDRLREQKGGTGAAALRARQCGGCMLSLDPAELSVIRGAADDEVVRCEECQRILVRTPESGI
jgi:predicted  nucleic acid-binding Zn-ribbon protein